MDNKEQSFIEKCRINLKGKIFSTECYITKCDCGNYVQQEFWCRKQEGEKEITEECIIGFCKCGNIFISQMPQKLKKSE